MTPEGKQRLFLDEGKRNFVYNDSTGIAITSRDFAAGGFPTIGVGRNLATHGLSDDEIELMFNNDIAYCETYIKQRWRSYTELHAVAQDVVVMVHFNTGNVFVFARMLTALDGLDYQDAAWELMNSNAAKQLPERYGRMRDALLHGVWAV